MNIKEKLGDLKLFADGADKKSILELNQKDYISGFTTNPTLLKASKITNYEEFAKDILSEIKDKPISFEVLSSEIDKMREEAFKICSWSDNNNVYIKIPVMDYNGNPTYELIEELSHNGIKVNATAVFTKKQVDNICTALKDGVNSVISVFCGRIADSGLDPMSLMRISAKACRNTDKNIELLWASPRELLNIIQAKEVGADIITCTNAILDKLNLLDKNLEEFSLETCRMFFDDAKKANLTV